MDRRKLIKLITTGTIAAPVVLAGCREEEKKEVAKEPEFHLDRNKEELEYEKSLLAKGKFFTDHELATITVLADIIIPKDDISGSASDAKVPGFIDFIVQDISGEDRAYDVPWVVLDSGEATRRWGWAVERTIEGILDELADHAEAHPEWLALSEG